MARGDAEVFRDGIDDLGASAATKLTWCLSVSNCYPPGDRTYRRANLHKVLAHRLAVVHGVERRDLVHTHRRHFQQPGDFVHHADAGPAELALAEVEEGHDGSLFVLGGIAFEDLVDELQVLLGELKWDAGVVSGIIAMLMSC